jgi:hypothetical protein
MPLSENKKHMFKKMDLHVLKAVLAACTVKSGDTVGLL